MKTMRAVVLILTTSSLLVGCMVPMVPVVKVPQPSKNKDFEQLDLKKMIDLYVNKPTSNSENNIEGIYTVSSVVTKKGKPLFANEEREKVKDRDENYAKVAIIRDPNNADREYMEISLNKDKNPSYSIIGEFTHLSESHLLVYKHIESRGKTTTYTFSYDASRDVLEGIRTDNVGKSTVTYQLTYMKVSSKTVADL